MGSTMAFGAVVDSSWRSSVVSQFEIFGRLLPEVFNGTINMNPVMFRLLFN